MLESGQCLTCGADGTKKKDDKECEYGHICTSSCGNDRDCPCNNEHWCSMSEKHTIKDCGGDCAVHVIDEDENNEPDDFSGATEGDR